MTDIVSGLFGLSPRDEYLKQQQAKDQAFAANLANAGETQGQKLGLLIGANLGGALGRGAANLFGLEDPQLAKISKVEGILQDVNSSLTDEERANPANTFYKLSQEFGQHPELQQEALLAQQKATQLGKEYDLAQAKIAQEEAQTQKARVESLAKGTALAQEQRAQAAIADLWAKKQAEGTTPTNEDIISVAAQYMPAEKLATMMQTSADKEAYRNVMVQQMNQQHEDRLARAADQKERDQANRDFKEQMIRLTASLKPKDGGSKSSVYERGYANNFVTSTAELVPATMNLNVLTNGGTSPVTAGIFTNLKGTGVLSASGAALGTAMTPQESGQYESIMLPVIANIATMQNAGRRTTQNQVDNLKSALLAKSGQPYLVQVQKMGELRQIAEAASEAAKTNPAMSEDQLAAINGNIERVRQAIPFTGTDVAKFSIYSKKNPGVKFVDWLKVNGSDKAAFGVSAIPKAAIDKLKANPTLAKDFDAKFGAGASKNYLGK